jgi:DNA replication protein DnaC
MSTSAFEGLFEFEDVEVPCDKHGTQTARRMTVFNGKPHQQPGKLCCPICVKEKDQARQDEERAQRAAEHAERIVTASRIPLNYANFRFDDYRADTAPQQRNRDLCARYVASLAERKAPGWLVLTGRPGTGKTMLLGCMVRALAGARIVSRYTTQAAMGREFRATYQRNAEISEAELFDRYAEVPVLMLDELAVFSTEGTDRVLFELLDNRYANGRPTVIATNHPRDRLEDVLGERLFDRLREAATFLGFDWESARKPAGQRNKHTGCTMQGDQQA